MNECQQPRAPAACLPPSRTNANSRWAPAACNPRSQTNADGRCVLLTCDPWAQAARTSANSRGKPPLVNLALERIPTAGGHQPLVILAPSWRMEVGLPLAGNASRPKECQQPATPAACNPGSRKNTISRRAPAACHTRSQTNIDSRCALATCDPCSLGGRGLPLRGVASLPNECQ